MKQHMGHSPPTRLCPGIKKCGLSERPAQCFNSDVNNYSQTALIDGAFERSPLRNRSSCFSLMTLQHLEQRASHMHIWHLPGKHMPVSPDCGVWGRLHIVSQTLFFSGSSSVTFCGILQIRPVLMRPRRGCECSEWQTSDLRGV